MKYKFCIAACRENGDWLECIADDLKLLHSYFFVAKLRAWFHRWVFK